MHTGQSRLRGSFAAGGAAPGEGGKAWRPGLGRPDKLGWQAALGLGSWLQGTWRTCQRGDTRPGKVPAPGGAAKAGVPQGGPGTWGRVQQCMPLHGWCSWRTSRGMGTWAHKDCLVQHGERKSASRLPCTGGSRLAKHHCGSGPITNAAGGEGPGATGKPALQTLQKPSRYHWCCKSTTSSCCTAPYHTMPHSLGSPRGQPTPAASVQPAALVGAGSRLCTA